MSDPVAERGSSSDGARSYGLKIVWGEGDT
jgi:hypothetical protein